MELSSTQRGAHTLANLITATRIATAVLLALAMLGGWPPALAATLVAYAATSDALDGRIARARREVTAFGAMLDQLADKIFIATALVLLIAKGAIAGADMLAALVILARETAVLALRRMARLDGMAAPVSALAKVKTASQYLAVFLLFAAAIQPGGRVLLETGLAVLWIAAGLSLVTATHYFMRMRENRWT
ncbi:CDP-alcohol phosphatidyltransferase [Rhodomicrobium vannielii ATCC 17100]|uniref:CDP-diacylglycerol--glycerol-3-phosphate 3-phosphatidyltransferase n=1 Tax=Rhodomicrobium vannielii (strain ATCC 17100 / DSM 162 / LMG 4299 / NCIMB 10020 / ATH 3.1.1) TaxID=648757 RepID=E3I534_RHOVT|nr:CDP-alcohol phosphatidyltransferase family protein [Rhodomicrobium vannielii]ADP69388.1 CDP-alcohol phosphatidyltransferase [Rhodomicrobium vannielii ATCC 17100]